MSEACRGFIQHAWNAEHDRKFSIKRMFDNYVDGFVQHAFEMTSICPECEKAARVAISVQRAEEGVFGEWKCMSCGKSSHVYVPIEQLVEDFNVARGCFKDGMPAFEEWRIQFKMMMSKVNVPCHEKPDKTIVGKFGAVYKEIDLETQKQKYRAYLSKFGKEAEASVC